MSRQRELTDVNAGTIYPVIHGLQMRGYLRVRLDRDGRTERMHNAIPPYGQEGLRLARLRVQELVGKRQKAGEP